MPKLAGHSPTYSKVLYEWYFYTKMGINALIYLGGKIWQHFVIIVDFWEVVSRLPELHALASAIFATGGHLIKLNKTNLNIVLFN